MGLGQGEGLYLNDSSRKEDIALVQDRLCDLYPDLTREQALEHMRHMSPEELEVLLQQAVMSKNKGH